MRMTTRLAFGAGALACAALIGIALYLQYFAGLEPCPLCMLQRVAFIVLGVVLFIGAVHGPARLGQRVYGGLALLLALTGAGLATRHIWLQYNPPKFSSCAGDIYSQLERLPLGRVISNALYATGDCAKVDWTLVGLSIAEWSLLWFVILGAWTVFALRRRT